MEQEGDRVGHSTLVESLKAALGVAVDGGEEAWVHELLRQVGHARSADFSFDRARPVHVLAAGLGRQGVRESWSDHWQILRGGHPLLREHVGALCRCVRRGVPRIGGLATQMARTAPPILQSDPLTVRQVIALERFVMRAPSMQDRCLAGAALVLVYSTCW